MNSLLGMFARSLPFHLSSSRTASWFPIHFALFVMVMFTLCFSGLIETREKRPEKPQNRKQQTTKPFNAETETNKRRMKSSEIMQPNQTVDEPAQQKLTEEFVCLLVCVCNWKQTLAWWAWFGRPNDDVSNRAMVCRVASLPFTIMETKHSSRCVHHNTSKGQSARTSNKNYSSLFASLVKMLLLSFGVCSGSGGMPTHRQIENGRKSNQTHSLGCSMVGGTSWWWLR